MKNIKLLIITIITATYLLFCIPMSGVAQELPTVKVLATGGTIVNLGVPNDFQGLSGADLIASVPGIDEFANIEIEQIVNLPSSKLTPEIWLKIAKRINEIFETENVDGIVITHGTDTLEETAYFLNLTIKSDKPVVLTGAMITARYPDSDGPRNLLSAVRVAASKDASNKGVLAVFNQRQIFAARNVEKINSVRVDAFDGGEFGILGFVDEDGVWFYQQPTKRHTINSEFDIAIINELPRVDIISSYAGADSLLLKLLVDNGVKGIVTQGTGAGNVTPDIEKVGKESIKEKGTVIVASSRAREGRVRAISVDLGILGDNLSPQKARILLMLALTKTEDVSEIQRMFFEY